MKRTIVTTLLASLVLTAAFASTASAGSNSAAFSDAYRQIASLEAASSQIDRSINAFLRKTRGSRGKINVTYEVKAIGRALKSGQSAMQRAFDAVKRAIQSEGKTRRSVALARRFLQARARYDRAVKGLERLRRR